MNWKRLLRHYTTGDWQIRRHFGSSGLLRIREAIAADESGHTGEIRFALEASLPPWDAFRNVSPRARAVDTFSSFRVWDTEHNNGILLYLLLADRDIEIVADRGIAARVEQHEWEKICRTMEQKFANGHYTEAVIEGIETVSTILRKHFPGAGGPNELADEPIII